MRISKRKLKRLIREACSVCGNLEQESMLDFTHAVESTDVPVPSDYDAVRDLLERNSELADLALSFVMIKAGASCERSTAQAIIDHLQDKLGTKEMEPHKWGADGLPGDELKDLKGEEY